MKSWECYCQSTASGSSFNGQEEFAVWFLIIQSRLIELYLPDQLL